MGLDASSSGDTSFPYSQLTPPLSVPQRPLPVNTLLSDSTCRRLGEGHRGRRKGNTVWGAPRSRVTGLAQRCRPRSPSVARPRAAAPMRCPRC